MLGVPEAEAAGGKVDRKDMKKALILKTALEDTKRKAGSLLGQKEKTKKARVGATRPEGETAQSSRGETEEQARTNNNASN